MAERMSDDRNPSLKRSGADIYADTPQSSTKYTKKDDRTDPVMYSKICGPALRLDVHNVAGRARALTLHMPHGPVETPVFMPVGTQGTVKGLTPHQLQSYPLNCQIILGNTYHLGNRPGGDTLEALGGLHKFSSWNRNILTDSGGFQMVSLLHLARITEEGVLFQSPVDGSEMMLTPEMSMNLQNQIGSDIMMALDDVVHTQSQDFERFKEACHRTIRWIDRCIAAHNRKTEQNLFGIVQGGLDLSADGLRAQCLELMTKRDEQLPGYAIGGLAGGEDKHDFWKVVAYCCERLPSDKPRYLMGVGYPLDLVVCSGLGVDMYDCVYPTRTGRFGTALVPWGQVKLKQGKFMKDMRPLDDTCECYVCKTYTRSYLHLLLKTDTVAPQLLAYHNVAYMMQLVRKMRQAILQGDYESFVREFLRKMFPSGSDSVPTWVRDAMKHVDINIGDWDSTDPAAAEGLRQQ